MPGGVSPCAVWVWQQEVGHGCPILSPSRLSGSSSSPLGGEGEGGVGKGGGADYELPLNLAKGEGSGVEVSAREQPEDWGW